MKFLNFILSFEIKSNYFVCFGIHEISGGRQINTFMEKGKKIDTVS